MSDFQALLMEGLFYQEVGQGLMVQPEVGAAICIADALSRLNGQNVQISVHHLPPSVDPTKWGGGCCMWQQVNSQAPTCPFGHHKHPMRLLNLVGQGTLKFADGSCVVHKFDGTTIDFGKALSYGLPGHYGRIAVATVIDLEKMREALMKSGDLGLVDDVGGRITDLKDLLGDLSNDLKGDS